MIPRPVRSNPEAFSETPDAVLDLAKLAVADTGEIQGVDIFWVYAQSTPADLDRLLKTALLVKQKSALEHLIQHATHLKH